MKTVAQFSAMRKGALDLSLYPILLRGQRGAGDQYRPDAGARVSSYAAGRRRGRRPRRSAQKFSAYLNEKGVDHRVVDLAGRRTCQPLDAGGQLADGKGMKIRGGSREMDMVFQAAGATTLNTPSNEPLRRDADRRLRRLHVPGRRPA